MTDDVWLAERFQDHRPRLRAMAYRMLGSLNEADDAVQEGWLRLNRSEARGVENLGGWLTTVVARVCLDMLRSHRSRRDQLVGGRLPEPIISAVNRVDPEHEAIMADAVGFALLVVLQTLTPAERLAFVLHDTFGVPFEEIADIVGRSPAAARQLASRARRRVRQAHPIPDADLIRQRKVVDAFFAAAHNGDFDALVAVLDPEVVLRTDRYAASTGVMEEVRGVAAVARRALAFSSFAESARPVLVNGAVGAVVAPQGRPFSIMGFTVRRGRISALDIIADPVRVGQLELAMFEADIP